MKRGCVPVLLVVMIFGWLWLGARPAQADPHATFLTAVGQRQLFFNILAALNQADYVEPEALRDQIVNRRETAGITPQLAEGAEATETNLAALNVRLLNLEGQDRATVEDLQAKALETKRRQEVAELIKELCELGAGWEDCERGNEKLTEGGGVLHRSYLRDNLSNLGAFGVALSGLDEPIPGLRQPLTGEPFLGDAHHRASLLANQDDLPVPAVLPHAEDIERLREIFARNGNESGSDLFNNLLFRIYAGGSTDQIGPFESVWREDDNGRLTTNYSWDPQQGPSANAQSNTGFEDICQGNLGTDTFAACAAQNLTSAIRLPGQISRSLIAASREAQSIYDQLITPDGSIAKSVGIRVGENIVPYTTLTAGTVASAGADVARLAGDVVRDPKFRAAEEAGSAESGDQALGVTLTLNPPAAVTLLGGGEIAPGTIRLNVAGGGVGTARFARGSVEGESASYLFNMTLPGSQGERRVVNILRRTEVRSFGSTSIPIRIGNFAGAATLNFDSPAPGNPLPGIVSIRISGSAARFFQPRVAGASDDQAGTVLGSRDNNISEEVGNALLDPIFQDVLGGSGYGLLTDDFFEERRAEGFANQIQSGVRAVTGQQ